ncbi:branched-chain amino acid transport system II carrier protein [Xenorhabdus mauleonii]|uniref:Branched-chain amino acid transport system carrier protein n=1 Tax=Xenorhabdus mauleonii TaxID=351675 RepID=A0A1I3KSD6_9GAMM|nr:branched-chain amino acid transport system II carrier protein [Xenorhabdus mauleonii]PHM45143.1 branched-chain amino acid transport system II carrier protein [Xenorhabdus mauleonii]SFI75451.1 Branched-chain amino acid transport protein [Xenorhabdus mauleonii]
MIYRLPSKYIWALVFITFALFAGVGNIITPSMVSLLVAGHVWSAAAVCLLMAVFLLRAVSLPRAIKRITHANNASIRGLA